MPGVRRRGAAILRSRDFSDKVTSEQTPEGSERQEESFKAEGSVQRLGWLGPGSQLGRGNPRGQRDKQGPNCVGCSGCHQGLGFYCESRGSLWRIRGPGVTGSE